MSEPLPVYATLSDRPPQWELESRRESGVFVVSRSGALLFRIELAVGMLYLWDKRAGVEVPIRIHDLLQLTLPSV